MFIHSNTNTVIDVDVDVEMARMTMYHILSGCYFLKSILQSVLMKISLYGPFIETFSLVKIYLEVVFLILQVFKMPDCPRIQSVRNRNEKITMREPVWYWTKLMQYRTEIMGAGILMPALVSSMPMPSYSWYLLYNKTGPSPILGSGHACTTVLSLCLPFCIYPLESSPLYLFFWRKS